jgi:hypothetical protein
MRQERGAEPLAGERTEPVLPHQPGAFRQWLARHPAVVDAAVTLLCVVLSAVPPLLVLPEVFASPTAVAGLVVGAGWLLLFRRRRWRCWPVPPC